MTNRIFAALGLLSCILLITPATAQPGDRRLNMKARVLSLLFPLDVESKPYIFKMALRFSDSDTQLVVICYPGGNCELIRYSLADIKRGELDQLISKMIEEKPDLKEQDIVSKVKVNINRTPINYDALERSLNELKTIRISPVLASRIAVDDYYEYEFWYDNWQESVHYTIAGPFENSSQDKLVKWMIKFRDRVPNLLNASLTSTKAKSGRRKK